MCALVVIPLCPPNLLPGAEHESSTRAPVPSESVEIDHVGCAARLHADVERQLFSWLHHSRPRIGLNLYCCHLLRRNEPTVGTDIGVLAPDRCLWRASWGLARLRRARSTGLRAVRIAGHHMVVDPRDRDQQRDHKDACWGHDEGEMRLCNSPHTPK